MHLYANEHTPVFTQHSLLYDLNKMAFLEKCFLKLCSKKIVPLIYFFLKKVFVLVNGSGPGTLKIQNRP